MSKGSSRSIRTLNILFFIWSFPAFLYAIYHIRNKRYHAVILLFSFLFGYSLILTSTSSDVFDYTTSFELMRQITLNEFLTSLLNILKRQDNESNIMVMTQGDIYTLTLQYIISRFTSNARWFFAIASVIYTYLFLRFSRLVVKDIKWKSFWPVRFFYILFLIVIPFYVGATGIRFWTALYLFCIFSYLLIKRGRIKYMFFASFSVFIHFSFIIPIVFLIIYHLGKKSKLLLNTFLLVSVLILLSSSYIESVFNFMNEYSEIFGDQISQKVNTYANLDFLETRNRKISELNWYVSFNNYALTIFLILLFLLERIRIIKWDKNEIMKNLYPFITIFLALALISYNLGSIGRYKRIFMLFSFIYLTIMASIPNNKLISKYIGIILIPIMIIYAYVIFRTGIQTFDIKLLIVNPITVFILLS